MAVTLVPACLAAKKPVTVDAVMDSVPGLAGHAAAAIVWSPDSARFVFSERGALLLYEAKSGKQREILKLSALESFAVPAPPPPVFDWTNRRVGESDVQWFADGKRLLVAAAGDLFIVDVAKGGFEALTQTPEAERDPKLSPDNRFVSFRRGSDLYVADVVSKHVTALTAGGTDTLLNGQLDWVYPEELDLATAHWWAPDSQSIAYLQFDVSREPVFPQVSLLNGRGIAEPERYPQPGDANADVRLGVVSVKGGATKWMDLGDPRASLLARVAWAPSGKEIMIERLNRVQNQLDLLLARVETGAARVVLHEEDAKWINVKEGPRFLGAGDRFLWMSESTGFFHLYVYGTDGRLVKQLTSGDWEVDRIALVDEKAGRVFFTSGESSPVERQAYSVGLDGLGKRRLTRGAGTHAISVSPDGTRFLDDFSSVNEPPRSTLVAWDGAEPRAFREADTSERDTWDLLPTELVQVTAADGTTLYARLIKPAGFRAGVQYPAIVMVYGGPGIQTIRNEWQGVAWDQVLAHRGFVIWQLDNRGSSGRGHAFETPIWHDTGAHELADQREGIDYLFKQGFVDAARLGMFGWSYGGYMTLYTATHAPKLLKAGIIGAPVTDWRNYDTIYTERYMGLPESDPEAYRRTSPQTVAANLQGTKLLMIHNMEDDNVHFQNTLQMADAFEKAGKPFRMLVYPQRTHFVAGPARRHLLDETTAFFEETLK